MEARLCLHGTKVASSCQRLTFALAHTPECTRLFLLRWCQACTTSILKYTCTDASAMADAAIAGAGVQTLCSPALAFLYLWPPSPLAIIHGSFASPGPLQCRKNGMIAALNCPRPVTALLAVPGSAR